MNFEDYVRREFKHEFEKFLRFDRGCSRSIALRACREVAPGTIAYRLPFTRKMKAYSKALRRWLDDQRKQST